jgi:4-hydroxy-3-polyprenylbenzoate decarboxylase
LLLALAEDRYWPTGEKKPREMHTLAHALLGYGQLSLAKFLFMADAEDVPHLNIRDVPEFMGHILSRCNFARDLHFITRTTMDTLDYSGGSLNEGSKVFVTVSGPPRRKLFDSPQALPSGIAEALEGQFRNPRWCAPGILAVEAEPFLDEAEGRGNLRRKLAALEGKILGGNPTLKALGEGCPLWVVTENSEFAAQNADNLWWLAFTRSDPAPDLTGLFATQSDKHWGCQGPLLLDARIKPWHAPVLEPDPALEAVERKLESMAGPGGPLHGLL